MRLLQIKSHRTLLRRDIDRPGSVVAAVLADVVAAVLADVVAAVLADVVDVAEVAALLLRTFAGLNGSVCGAFFRGIYNTHSHKRIHGTGYTIHGTGYTIHGMNIRINRPVMPQISWHI